MTSSIKPHHFVAVQAGTKPAAKRPSVAWHGRLVSHLRDWTQAFHGHIQRILTWAGNFFRNLRTISKQAKPPVAKQILARTPAKPTFRAVSRLAVAQGIQAPALNPAEAQFQGFLTNMCTMMGISVYNRLIQPNLGTYASDLEQIPSRIPGLPACIASRLSDLLKDAVSKIQNKVGVEIQQKLATNAQIVGQNLSARALAIIQAASLPGATPASPTLYQQSYDQIVALVYGHVQAVASVNGISDSNQRRLAFSKLPACDPRMKTVIDQNGVVNANALDNLETTIFTQLSQNLIALLLPPVTSNGTTTPGLIALLRQLQIAPALQNAYQKIFQDLPGVGQEVMTSVTNLIEQTIAAKAGPDIQAGLALGLKTGIDQVVNPAYLNMWMSQGAFPAIFNALVAAVVKARLYSPSDAILKAFIPLTNPSTNFQIACNQIIPLLYQDAVNCCKEITTAGVTQTVFATFMTPYLQAVSANFQQKAAGKSVNTGMVKDWLRSFNQSPNAGDNTDYGKILFDFLFKIGNLKVIINKDLTEDICKAFLQKMASRAITSVFNPIRASDQLLLTGLTSALQQVLGTQAEVDSVLFDPATPPVNVSSAMNQQFNNIGNITRDLILQLIGQIPDGASWYSKPFKDLGVDVLKKMVPSGGSFSNIYSSVYNSLLQDSFINESLYFQLQDILVRMFQNSSSSIQRG